MFWKISATICLEVFAHCEIQLLALAKLSTHANTWWTIKWEATVKYWRTYIDSFPSCLFKSCLKSIPSSKINKLTVPLYSTTLLKVLHHHSIENKKKSNQQEFWFAYNFYQFTCGVCLTLVGHQMPITIVLSLPFLRCRGEQKCNKRLQAGRSSITIMGKRPG